MKPKNWNYRKAKAEALDAEKAVNDARVAAAAPVAEEVAEERDDDGDGDRDGMAVERLCAYIFHVI